MLMPIRNVMGIPCVLKVMGILCNVLGILWGVERDGDPLGVERDAPQQQAAQAPFPVARMHTKSHQHKRRPDTLSRA